MGDYGLTKAYSAIVGVVLVLIGLLGFIGNPIVGSPGVDGAADPLFVTGMVHDILHLATGGLALYIAYRLTGQAQANAVIGFGVLYVVIFGLTIIHGRLFGVLGPDASYNVSLADHVLHGALGVVSIAVGYIVRSGTGAYATR